MTLGFEVNDLKRYNSNKRKPAEIWNCIFCFFSFRFSSTSRDPVTKVINELMADRAETGKVQILVRSRLHWVSPVQVGSDLCFRARLLGGLMWFVYVCFLCSSAEDFSAIT